MDKLWRKGEYTDGPNSSDYFTAGIDARMPDRFGKPSWHFHAIEFHSHDKAEAERRRDIVFDYLERQNG